MREGGRERERTRERESCVKLLERERDLPDRQTYVYTYIRTCIYIHTH